MECFATITCNFGFLSVMSKEDVNQFPFNSSMIAELCQIDQSQQNLSQLCSCCNRLLRRLLGKFEGLEKEEDISQYLVTQQNGSKTKKDKIPQDSGSGSGYDLPEEFLNLE